MEDNHQHARWTVKMNGQRKWIALIAFVVLAPVVFWVWDRSAVLDYGAPGKTYLSPNGKEICFDDVTWLRACPSAFHWYVTGSDGRRHDGDQRILQHDGRIGKLPPKCRAIRLPELPPGPATIHAWATSGCFPFGFYLPIWASVPDVKFEVKMPEVPK